MKQYTPFCQTHLFGMRVYLYIVLLMSLVLAPFSLVQASGGMVTKNGVVATRGLVKGPNGQPIYAEIDDQGVSHTIGALPNGGEAIGELSKARVISGDAYRAMVKAYHDFLSEHKTDIARGAEVYSRQAYIDYAPGSISVPQPDGKANKLVPVPKPELRDNTLSVLVRNLNTITDPGALPTYGPQRGIILLESAIDLRNLNRIDDLPASIASVLINNDGVVLYQSKMNIGFRTAYVKPTDGSSGDPVNDNSLQELFTTTPIPDLWGPIANARIESPMSSEQTFTDTDGKFRLRTNIPPCPGFFWIYEYNVSAWLKYRVFDPQDPQQGGRYYPFSGPTYDVCSGMGDLPLGGSLAGAMTQMALMSSDANLNLSGSYRPVKIIADVILFNGDAIMSNDGAKTIPIADSTTYAYAAPMPTPTTAGNLDLNGDKITDTEKPSGDKVDVYFNAPAGTNAAGQAVDAKGNVVNPDLQRLADTAPDFSDQGLLKSISLDDFKNTDLYVFRQSNGQLVVEREGIDENFIIKKDNRFFYRLLLPGPRAYRAGQDYNGTIAEAQAAAGIPKDLQGFHADFLRSGEMVKVIAINRATGYIATTVVQVDMGKNGDSTKQQGGLDFPIDRLILRPPNLKIRAERMFTVQSGLSKGDERKYQIGFEGSALKTDTYIKIMSDWVDQDGTPLPDELKGYSGRLAKVVGPNSLGDNAVSFFSIKPGTYTQLVKLEGDILGSEHFYVQVSGKYIDADFSTTGAGQGPLQYRPKHYVPFRVPVLDETKTRQARNTALYLGKKPEYIPAVYEWPYRPEMQFSVFDLTLKGLEVTDINDTKTLLDITGDDPKANFTNLALLLDDKTQYADLLYSLLANQNNPLAPLGKPRELVFSLGADEVQAELAPDGSVQFKNMEQLNLLNASDMLSLRLYQNSDMENILWEYGFDRIRLIADMNNDGEIIKEPTEANPIADTNNNKKHPFLFWKNDDDDVGEINEGKAAKGDVPGYGTPDYENDKIDGMRDLVDFFPVYVDVKSAIDAFPITEYTYRLVHQGGKLKFTETDFLKPVSDYDWQRVDAPLKHPGIAATLADKTVTTITSSGVALSNNFLESIKNDTGGIILVEGAGDTDDPLKLEIVKNSNQKVMVSAELAIKIHGVEKMYRQINLRPCASGRTVDPRPAPGSCLTNNADEPENNPDERTKPKYFVFVHGYNVTAQAARGWNAEIFKRFYRLGFNGRFIGVDWFGDTGLDYHYAVYNALQSGMYLNAAINRSKTEDGPVTIAGHSLGNMVISNAIEHGGLVPDKYFMINAAVPIEAYDPGQKNAYTRGNTSAIEMKGNMTEASWIGYPEDLFAANWYKLFSDARKNITWKGYFSDVAQYAYNFYSPGDEVMENANKNDSFSSAFWKDLLSFDFASHAWVMQEMGKGCNNLASWAIFKCSGGWRFNEKPADLGYIGKINPAWDKSNPDDEYIKYSSTEAQTAWNDGINGEITKDEVAQYGFFSKFSHFSNGIDGYAYLYQPIASKVVLERENHQWDLLASAIPAMSFGAAVNAVNKFNQYGERNFDMEALRGQNQEWPVTRIDNTVFNKRWLHSDIRNVALPYVYQTFDTMLSEGALK